MSGMGTSTNCSTTCGSGSEERGGAWRIKSQALCWPSRPSRQEESGPGSSARPPLSPPSADERCGREGQPARSRRSAPHCAAKPVPADQTQRTEGQEATRRQAHLRRQGKSTQCLPPGSWDAPERGRAVLLVPTTRTLPSSVYAARAMRTVCCSRRYHERSRRSLLRCAAPITGCQPDSAMTTRLHLKKKSKPV